MSYSKRQIVIAAFEELGLASYAFDIQPEELESALRRLDGLVAQWNARGMKLSYNLPNSPQNSNIDDESYIPDYANDAVITNLAIKLAPSYGRVVSQETKSAAHEGERVLLMVSQAGYPLERRLQNTLPLGAGNNKGGRGKKNIFYKPPEEPLYTDSTGELDFY